MISTSPIKISCVIDRALVPRAVQALHCRVRALRARHLDPGREAPWVDLECRSSYDCRSSPPSPPRRSRRLDASGSSTTGRGGISSR